MSWQAAVIKFQCISVKVTYLFSFLYAVTRSWLAWSWELGFKAPPCESCQLIYLFLSSGSSWCVIQKLLKERGWVNLWFSSFESSLEVLLHILPSCGSEIGFDKAHLEPVSEKSPVLLLERSLKLKVFLAELWYLSYFLGPESPWFLFLSRGVSAGGEGSNTTWAVRCEGQVARRSLLFYPYPSITLQGQWLLVQIMFSWWLLHFAKPLNFASGMRVSRELWVLTFDPASVLSLCLATEGAVIQDLLQAAGQWYEWDGLC